MKKKIICVALVIVTVCTLMMVGCKKVPEPDYNSAKELAQAIDDGEDVDGKIVKFTVKDYDPNAPMGFGHCLDGGYQMKFCSEEKPKADQGDTIIVEIVNVKNVFGSYVIAYELLDIVK